MTSQSLEDDPAAHGDEVAGPPDPVVLDAVDGEIGDLVRISRRICGMR